MYNLSSVYKEHRNQVREAQAHSSAPCSSAPPLSLAYPKLLAKALVCYLGLKEQMFLTHTWAERKCRDKSRGYSLWDIPSFPSWENLENLKSKCPTPSWGCWLRGHENVCVSIYMCVYASIHIAITKVYIYTHTCACVLNCSVMSSSLQPHGLWSARLLYPWDFPGKNVGVGCHLLL